MFPPMTPMGEQLRNETEMRERHAQATPYRAKPARLKNWLITWWQLFRAEGAKQRRHEVRDHYAQRVSSVTE